MITRSSIDEEDGKIKFEFIEENFDKTKMYFEAEIYSLSYEKESLKYEKHGSMLSKVFKKSRINQIWSNCWLFMAGELKQENH